jgi:ribulose-5-phosphate 4-epimerase/fuculose-1-phosphate aldolase
MKRMLFPAWLGAIALSTFLIATPVVAGEPVANNPAEELVVLNRVLASKEMSVFGVYGHASIRSKTNPNRFYIASNLAPALMTVKDIYESDLDGQPAGGARGNLIEERFIHAEIYRARPDVGAVALIHTPELAAFSVSSVALPRGRGRVPVFDIRKAEGGRGALVNTPALGRALAQALAKDPSILVFGQGAVAVAGTSRDLVTTALALRTGAEARAFDLTLGGATTALAFTREKAIPEAGGGDLGPSGGIQRVDRLGVYYNFLGARDLAKLPSYAPSPEPASDKELIRDLVIAHRMLVAPEMGVLTPDGFAHVSVRSRANPNHFFIARDMSPGMLTEADIIETDLDTRPVNGQRVAQFSERFIHAEIYRARPEVQAVLHAHTPELKTFGQSSARLRPVFARARFVGGGFPIYDLTQFTGGAPSPVACTHCISTPELGRSLVKVMGSAPVSLLFDHGISMVDTTLRSLVVNAYNLRMNARIQQLAIGLKGEVGYFEPGQESYTRPNPVTEWDYWKQMLIGDTNINAAPQPAVGLPLNLRTF